MRTPRAKFKLPRRSQKGFTILETLVALAGGVILLFGVFELFSLSRRSLAASNANAEMVQNGRVALERIARDLRQGSELLNTLPSAEIEFLDGHNPDAFNYLRYYLTENMLYRELSYYSFASDPQTHVRHSARDINNQPPQKTIVQTDPVAEYITSLNFSGTNPLAIRISLTRSLRAASFSTSIFSRNLMPL